LSSNVDNEVFGRGGKGTPKRVGVGVGPATAIALDTDAECCVNASGIQKKQKNCQIWGKTETLHTPGGGRGGKDKRRIRGAGKKMILRWGGGA